MENVDTKLTKPLNIIILVIVEKTEIVYGIKHAKTENALIYVRMLLVVGMKNAKMENALEKISLIDVGLIINAKPIKNVKMENALKNSKDKNVDTLIVEVTKNVNVAFVLIPKQHTIDVNHVNLQKFVHIQENASIYVPF